MGLAGNRTQTTPRFGRAMVEAETRGKIAHLRSMGLMVAKWDGVSRRLPKQHFRPGFPRKPRRGQLRKVRYENDPHGSATTVVGDCVDSRVPHYNGLRRADARLVGSCRCVCIGRSMRRGHATGISG